MKKLTLLIAAAVALSCVGSNGDSPIRLRGTFPTNPNCDIKTDVSQYRGSLNLAGIRQLGANAASFADYIMILEVESDLSTPSTSANGSVLSDQSRNTLYLDQIILNYKTDAAISFSQDITNIYAPLAAQGGDPNPVDLVADFLGPKGAQALLDSVTPGSAPVEVRIQVQLRGHHASGGYVYSDLIEFPIQVFDTGTVCSAGPALTGPCGNVGGQDGTAVCAPTADGGV